MGAMAQGLRDALLPDDPDLEGGADLGGQLHRHRVDPEGLDRLLDGDLPLVDRETLLLEGRGDVHRGHGPEELVALAGGLADRQRERAELRRQRLGVQRGPWPGP